MQPNNFFDESYVEKQKTVAIVNEHSAMKEFIKNPVSKDDIAKYGSSKPKRKLMRAVIEHDKG